MKGSVARKWLYSAALGVSACLLGAMTPARAAAQAAPAPAPAAAPAPAPPSMDIGGMVDVYYDYYTNKPTGDAVLRNFDVKHNQFALSMAEAWLTKAPTTDSRTGFRVLLNYGPSATNYINGGEPGGASYANIEEAYVSYLAPVGTGLQVDVGKWVTTAGAEVIEATGDWNYSRSFLFALTIPYYHSGIRMKYSPNSKVSLLAGLVNGWNNVQDNNTGKTVMGSISLTPSGSFSLSENYIGGPEQTGDNKDWRHLSDTVISVTASPTVSLLGNIDYGRDTVAGQKVHWDGVAGALKVQATPVVAFSPRFEYMNDPQGFMTGTVQKLKEVTATLELKAADNLIWRLEYRTDFSNQSVFAKSDGSMSDKRTSLGFGLMYSFDGKIQ